MRISDAATGTFTIDTMRAPIPQRIAPLAWRAPAFLWTPLALAIAIGWPAAVFYYDPTPQRLALIAGLAVFAIALISLGAAWALGKAPRTRLTVITHVIVAGIIVAIAAPFVLTQLLELIAAGGEAPAQTHFGLSTSLAMTPLALLLGLPIALVSGAVFSVVALTRKASVREIDLLEMGEYVEPRR